MAFTLPKLFPHFSHRIPSRLFFSLELIVLWFSLVALFTVNIIVLKNNRPAHWNELMKLFVSPFTVSRHVDLAAILWQQGQKPEARHLMISAQTLSGTVQSRAQGNTVNILGSRTSPMDILSQWEHEADQLNSRYTFWQTVASAKPEYRDAFVTLSVLAFQLGKFDESNRWVRQALVLDPNNATAQTLTRFFQEK